VLKRRLLTTAALVAVCSSTLMAQAQQASRAPNIVVQDPVILDTTGLFLAMYARVGDDLFIGGQPTEKALRELRAQGVTTIVNLRTPEEMQRAVKYDEAALAKELGIRYVHIPVRGSGDMPYAPSTVARFTEALATADGKVLLHCTIAWRASHLWAAYLIKERNVPVETALANARAINLMDNHRMGGNGRQPVEDFLDRTLPTLGRPPR
jgi:uncharacterized protein (TIGR01244 family)